MGKRMADLAIIVLCILAILVLALAIYRCSKQVGGGLTFTGEPLEIVEPD